MKLDVVATKKLNLGEEIKVVYLMLGFLFPLDATLLPLSMSMQFVH